MEKERTASIILRFGLAFGFIYAAVSAFISPQNWIGFLPIFLQSNVVLNIFGVIEIIIGVWLLSGWKIFYSAIISMLMVGGLIVFNIGAFDIIFRDVVILLAAIALAVLNKN